MSVLSPTSTSARPQQHRGGLRLLVVSGLLWGTGGLTGRLLTRDWGLSPAAVAGYRLLIGGLLILGFLTAAGRPAPRGRSAWTRVTLIGLLAACFQACYFTAVAWTSVSLATLVAIGAAPIVVLAVERAAGRRRLTPAAVGTVALAILGLALLVGRPTPGPTTGTLLGGLGLALGAATGFAAISLVGTRPVTGLDDLTLTGWAFLLGGAVLLPSAALGGGASGIGIPARPEPVLLLLALGLAPTALAYTLYFKGLRSVAASTATLTALLEPLTGSVLAAAVLGDRLGLAGLVGAALLAVSVTAETWRARTRVAA